MGKPRVYVETTVPSFYHEERTAPAIVARREWTQRWWDGAPARYELVTSPAVLDELAGGIPGTQCETTGSDSWSTAPARRAGDLRDRPGIYPAQGNAG